MAVTLSCSMCGAPTHADAGALRQGFTACRSCGTLHRVTEAGVAPSRASDALDTAPAGVGVQHRGDRLSLTAQLSTTTNAAFGREVVSGLALGVAALLLAWRYSPVGILVPVAGLVGFFVGLIVMGKLRRVPPPVVLSGGVLHSGVRFKKIPAGEVVQIYTTEFATSFGPLPEEAGLSGAASQAALWVCALC